jgi:tight adherence protein C
MLELGALLLFGAIALMVLAILWREDNPLEARLSAIRGQTLGYDSRTPAPLRSRVLGPFAAAIGRRLAALLPTRLLVALERQLVLAGEPVTLAGFLVAALLSTAGLTSIGFTVATAAGGLQGTGLMLVLALGAVGAFLPRVWLANRVRVRQKEILKSLPDAFDLITVCVEAGLGLDAAMARVSEKVKGPFGEELTVTLREISLGKLRRDALKEMGERTGVPDLLIFINAVIQAEAMGTSIASVLRVQADSMRVRRRQRAEEQAHKAPVKMVFPLVLCIFPALFIVILGPAGITLYEQFGGR